VQMERLVMRCHGENETGDDAKLQGFQEVIPSSCETNKEFKYT